jgi:hypothetical protein
MNGKLHIVFLTCLAAFGQAPETGQSNGIDEVIALVDARMSEQFIIKHLQREGKPYNLTAEEIVKLRKGGASEKVIEAMMDPGIQGASPASVSSPAPVAQQPVAAADAPASGAKKKRGGFFGRLGETVRQTGENALSSAEETAANSLAAAENKAARTVEGAQQKADRAVQNKLQAGEQAIDTRAQVGGAPVRQKRAPAKR